MCDESVHFLPVSINDAHDFVGAFHVVMPGPFQIDALANHVVAYDQPGVRTALSDEGEAPSPAKCLDAESVRGRRTRAVHGLVDTGAAGQLAYAFRRVFVPWTDDVRGTQFPRLRLPVGMGFHGDDLGAHVTCADHAAQAYRSHTGYKDGFAAPQPKAVQCAVGRSQSAAGHGPMLIGHAFGDRR